MAVGRVGVVVQPGAVVSGPPLQEKTWGGTLEVVRGDGGVRSGGGRGFVDGLALGLGEGRGCTQGLVEWFGEKMEKS